MIQSDGGILEVPGCKVFDMQRDVGEGSKTRLTPVDYSNMLMI